MPSKKLTQKQEELAKSYIMHSGNKTAAYREVYPDSKATTQSIWTLAYRAFTSVELESRIQELQDLATERHLVTIETITAELEESYNMAKDNEQAVAMTGSSVAKGKLHGLFIEKTKVTLDATGDFLKAIQPTTGLPGERDD